MKRYGLLHRDTSISKGIETACMVEVQVPDDDSFDVFDIVPGLLDLRGEFHGFVVVHAGEDVVYGGPDDFGKVLKT